MQLKLQLTLDAAATESIWGLGNKAKGQLVLQENNSDLKTAGSSFSPEGVAPRDPGGKASPLLTASMGPASWRDCCDLSLPGLHQEMHVTPTLPRGLA